MRLRYVFLLFLCFSACVDDGDQNQLVSSGNGQTIKETSGVRADYQIKEVPTPEGEQEAQKTAGHVEQVDHDVIMNQQLRTMGRALQYMPSAQVQ